MKKDAAGLGNHPTDNQKANIQQKCNSLRRRLEAWFIIQGVYQPAATVKRLTVANGAEQVQAYDMPLLLPSAFNGIINTLDQALADIERRLRLGRALDSLGSLRENILVRGSMYRVKDREQRGQAMVTRAGRVLIRVNDHITDDKLRYRRHFGALGHLGTLLGNLDHLRSLRTLNDSDIANIGTSDESEGRRVLPWIWLASIDLSNERGLQDGMLNFVLLSVFSCFFESSPY